MATKQSTKIKELNLPQDITRHNCLLFTFAGFKSLWIFRSDRQLAFTVPANGRIIISNAIGLKECAIAGMGLAILFNWLISQDLKVGRLVKNYLITK